MPSSLQNQFKSILLKPEKTLEDAQFIYEKIRGFRFFEGFFATNLRSMDTYDILTLCQGFQYETMERGRFVFNPSLVALSNKQKSFKISEKIISKILRYFFGPSKKKSNSFFSLLMSNFAQKFFLIFSSQKFGLSLNLIILLASRVISTAAPRIYEASWKERVRRGDESNNKFYIILSGVVSIIAPNEQEQIAQTKARKTKKILRSLPRIEIIDDRITHMGDFSPQRKSFTQPPLLNQASFEDYSKLLSKRKTLKIGGTPTSNEMSSQEVPSPTESARLSKGKFPFPRFGTSLNHLAEINEQDEQNVTGYPTNRLQHSSLERLGNNDLVTLHTLKDIKGVTERESAIYLSSRRNNEEFAEEIAKYGRLLRDLEIGESFGDLALLSDAKRSASVLCKSDCEFLVVTKDQFDSLFLKKEAEKEEFLKVIFPFLTSDVISPGAFSMLLYSFKTEVYTRGSYLTIEGNPNTVNPKFFALQHGECVVEKTLPSDASTPNDKTRVHHEAAQIAVVGRGMLIGEEVLQPQRSYEYNVKAVTDHVVVYSITRFDFEAVFFKEFQAMVLDMYKKKKKQREIMFEISKKEHGQAKADHLYFIKSPNAKTPTAQKNLTRGFTRHAEREMKASSHDEASLNRLILSQKGGPRTQTDLSFTAAASGKEHPMTAPHIPDLDNSPIDDDHQGLSPSKSPTRGKVRIITIEEMKDPKRRNIEARIDFLQKIPEISKNPETALDPKEMERMKFFKEKDPKKIKVQNILKARLLNINLSKTPTALPRQTSAGIVSKDLAKSIRRLQSKSSIQTDFKGAQTLQHQFPTLEDESPSVLRPFSPKVTRTISLLTKLQESPLKSKPIPLTRAPTASTATNKRYSKVESRGFESYASSPANFNLLMLDTSPSKSSAFSKTLATEPDESPLIYQKNRMQTPNDYLIRHVLTIDPDTESSLVMSSKRKGDALSSKRGKRGGSKTPAAAVVGGGGNQLDFNKKGSGSQTPGNLHLKKKVEFRKKVFKKTSLKSLDLRATPMKGFTFMVNTLDSKSNKMKAY